MGVAVGVMARAPVPGRCKTRLAAVVGEQAAAEVYRAMLLDTLDGLARACDPATRLVVMAAPENDGVRALRDLAPARWEVVPQRGASLGDRLADAFRTLGAAGDRVALVDSDSPTVDWAEVGRALDGFEAGRRALMGPCDDGGYYLIALGALELGVLEGIPWSTSRVQTETRARCAALGLALAELPRAYDVDEPEDLARLRADLRARPGLAPWTAAALEALT